MHYLIFGGTGSLGKKLIDRLISLHHCVSVFSRDEAKHWTIKNEVKNNNLKFYVGDIRDKNRILNVLRQSKPDVVIIAAALKQVDTCELSPTESIQTNLLGTTNVIDSINELNDEFATIKAVLFVSTDKACSPVNVYGMCKAISERIVSSQEKTGSQKIRYLCTRYGNVLESRGSIIPLFKFQAENCAELTVTDVDMTRFVMTLDDSVDLILHALKHGNNGEIFIPKIRAMKIIDLAEIFAERYNKQIKITGIRPGEKLHEELVNESESIRVIDTGSHFVVRPIYEIVNQEKFAYTSADDVLSKVDLLKYLTSLNILDMRLDQFVGRNIEEIVMTK